MGIRAGDLRQINLGGRNFDPAPDSDVTIMLAGITLENTPNGNNTIHTKGKRVLGGVDGLVISIDPTRQDMEYIMAWAQTGVLKPCSISLIDGTTYTGALLPEGDIQVATGAGTLTIGLRGPKFVQV
jgi:hypothetical protein